MMRRSKLTTLGAFLFAVGLSSMAACSSMSGNKAATEIADTGPSVINARVNPGTVELTRYMNPKQNVEILAEVKDFQANVSDVRVRFKEAPVELKMKNVGGSTWRAELPANQIKRLAVGNQTTVYQAEVIARDSNGKVGMSQEPLKVSIKAPDLGVQAG
jgi:hypothetical protein